MRTKALLFCAVLLGGCTDVVPVQTRNVRLDKSVVEVAPSPAYIPVAQEERFPGVMGYSTYCQQSPECRIGALPAYLLVTSRELAEMERVFKERTRQFRYVSDESRFGRSHVWDMETEVGDCEEFAASLRKKLVALGVPQGALFFVFMTFEETVGGRSETRGHLDLAVRTQLGDFIFDYRQQRLVSWDGTLYDHVAVEDTAKRIWRPVGIQETLVADRE